MYNIIISVLSAALLISAVNWFYWRQQARAADRHREEIRQLYHDSLINSWTPVHFFFTSRNSNYVAVSGRCKTPSGIDRTIEIRRFLYKPGDNDSFTCAKQRAHKLLEKLLEK